MVKIKRQLCRIKICIQHNNKYFKIKDKTIQKKILSKNYALYIQKNLFRLPILKQKNSYIKKQLLNV